MGKKFIAIAVVLGALAVPAAAQANLTYQGGPIMPSVDNVVVNWGDRSNQPPGYMDYVDQYFTDVAANSYSTNDVFANDEQYQPTNGQLLTHKQTFHGEYDITPANTSTTLSETDIGAELAAQISAGHLPPPQPGPSTGYFVMVPADSYNFTLQGTPANQSWCDYHYNQAYGSSGTQIVFAVIPTWSAGTANAGGCGRSNQTLFQNQTVNISHQQNEMITDPIDANTNTGWYDSGRGEIGDLCLDQGGPMSATNVLNGTTYTVQQEWSNAANSCVGGPVKGTTGPTATFTFATDKLTAAFDGGASSSANNGINSDAWSYGDGSTGSGAHPSHAYAAPGTYSVTLEVTDNHGFLSKTTQSVTVSVPATGGGGGGGGGAGSGGNGGGGLPTVAQIDAALTQLLGAPSTDHTTIPTVLATGGVTDEFTAPGPGTVLIQWYYVPPGAHVSRAAKPVLVAQGQKYVSSSGVSSVHLSLTPRGRSLLRHAKTVHLTARATFTPVGGRAVTQRRSIKLGRR